jgi:N-methylhydantoinase A/oxoprolinase/acetone carboxylase beta subunit
MAALGLLGCPIEHAAPQAVHRRLDEVQLSEILLLVDKLRGVVTPRMAREAGDNGSVTETIILEFCFQGQSNNMALPCSADELRTSTAADIGDRFVARYRSLFGHAPSAPIVLLRVEVVLTLMRAAPVAHIPAGIGHEKSDTRTIRLPGSKKSSAARLASRSDLQAKAADGPLIVEQTDCTLLFEDGWRVSCDPQGLLIARRETVAMPELHE